ncbi:energy transducer TonB [Aquitalea denitrificans]|uniref:energy transducer TonB n=1 Tax=Aquitalea denitrificans TaxID=519081 RepID=UPI0013594635|nr:energy transducer TonB [Aquitalea denitrificans]
MKLHLTDTLPSSSQPLSIALLLSGLVHVALLAILINMLLAKQPTLPLPSLHLRLLPANQSNTHPPVIIPARAGMPTAKTVIKPLRQTMLSRSLPNPAVQSHDTPSPSLGAGAATVRADTVTATSGNSTNSSPTGMGSSDNQPAIYHSAYLHNPQAPYPERSRELGEQGRVQLKVRVSTQGKALQVEIVSSSHSRRLDEAARLAVAEWRFLPARQDGVAIESTLLVPVSFVLSP